MSNISVRVDDELKTKAQETFNELGLDLSTGIKMYLKQVVLRQAIPFEVTLEKSDIELAIEDLKSGRVNQYDNLEDLFDELDNEDWKTNIFEKNYKNLKKKHYNMYKLKEVTDLIVTQQKEELVRVYKDHQLQGNLKEFRELHIESDWLLVYKVKDNNLTLLLIATGKHDEVFRSASNYVW